jgi:MFS transporter, CP family, cyanate transporter
MAGSTTADDRHSTGPAGQPTVEVHGARWLVLVALVLTGFTMRSAVTSIGPVLTELQDGLRISDAQAGVITTLPVLCFAAIGSVAPRLAHRFGFHRVVVIALLAATAGVLSRAVAATFAVFVILSVLALAGGAIANVLMPSLVKRHFPEQIGRMTAAYTTAMAIGMTAASGLTVPLTEHANSWRFGIGFWSVLSAVAVLPWLPTLRGDRPDHERGGDPQVRLGTFVRSRTAWALTVMFAFQSMQAYICFGWLAEFFRHKGMSAEHAGWLIAFYAALSIPVSAVIPSLAVRAQRPLVVAMALSAAVAYLGLLAAPIFGAVLWMCLAGIGSGMFPLSLTMLGLRSRRIVVTSGLSAFVQTWGYVIAGFGPLLVGLILDATGGNWAWPFILLLTALALSAAGGWFAGRNVKVDDELKTPATVSSTVQAAPAGLENPPPPRAHQVDQR